MSVVKRGIVKSYDAAAHRATVQIAGSLGVWLDDVRVATDIPAADVVAGRQCTVLFLDPSNQDDALVLTIQGALPSGGGGGTSDHAALTNLGYGAAGHTGFVASAGVSGGQTVQGGTAASEQLTLESTAHATKGEVRVADGSLFGLREEVGHYIGQAGTRADVILRLRPAASSFTFGALHGIMIDPQIQPDADGRTYVGITGAMLVGGSTARTNANVLGLDFQIVAFQNASGADLIGCSARPSTMLLNGTWTSLIGLRAQLPTHIAPGAGAAFTNGIGALIQNYGHSKITTAIGLKVEPQSGSTNNYLAWLERSAGNPSLRLDAGNPPNAGLGTEGDSQLYLAWMENGTVNLRQVRWRQQSSLGATDKVLIAA